MVGVDKEWQGDVVEGPHIRVAIACFKIPFHFLCFDFACR
jgi:hypothetical protein